MSETNGDQPGHQTNGRPRNGNGSAPKGIRRELNLIWKRGKQVWRLVSWNHKGSLFGAAVLMALTSLTATLIPIFLGGLVDGIQAHAGEGMDANVVYWLAVWFLGLIAAVAPFALRAEEAPLARYATVAVETARTSIYIGSVTLAMPAFTRQGITYSTTYAARVFPYFFYNEKGSLSIDVTDADLRRLERGETIEFTGRAKTTDGEDRHIEGRAQPTDQVSLQHGYAAIAETGTLMLPAAPERPTTMNLLSDTFMVVLRASRIVGAYEEAWDLLRAERQDPVSGGFMPRNVMLVTGPSRSADIESTLELGAHGPRRLHVLLVDDDPAALA